MLIIKYQTLPIIALKNYLHWDQYWFLFILKLFQRNFYHVGVRVNMKIKHTYFSEVENERILYHGLRFLSMRKRLYGNLDSIQIYLGKIYMGKRQKVYVCIMREKTKVLKKAVVVNETFEMHRGMDSSLLSVHGFWVLKVTAVFCSGLSAGFPSSSKQAGENPACFSCLMPESAAFAGMSCSINCSGTAPVCRASCRHRVMVLPGVYGFELSVGFGHIQKDHHLLL